MSWVNTNIQVIWCFLIDLSRLLLLNSADLWLLIQHLKQQQQLDAFWHLVVHKYTLEHHSCRKDLDQSRITEFELGYKADINISACVRSCHRYESSVSSHQPDQTNSIVDSSAFNICWADGSIAFRYSSLETKWFVDDWNIVVDSFWNSDYTYL